MGTYWEKSGKYENLASKVSERVRVSLHAGDLMADTKEAEAMRTMLWVQRLYYDAYNNGWCKWKKEDAIYRNFKMFVSPYLKRHRIRYTSFERLYKDLALLEYVVDETVLCVAKDIGMLR